jgi:hypothetical protein
MKPMDGSRYVLGLFSIVVKAAPPKVVRRVNFRDRTYTGHKFVAPGPPHLPLTGHSWPRQ